MVHLLLWSSLDARFRFYDKGIAFSKE